MPPPPDTLVSFGKVKTLTTAVSGACGGGPGEGAGLLRQSLGAVVPGSVMVFFSQRRVVPGSEALHETTCTAAPAASEVAARHLPLLGSVMSAEPMDQRWFCSFGLMLAG